MGSFDEMGPWGQRTQKPNYFLIANLVCNYAHIFKLHAYSAPPRVRRPLTLPLMYGDIFGAPCGLRAADVLAVILSDVMFFLSESNQKYTFFAQDNKVCKFRCVA